MAKEKSYWKDKRIKTPSVLQMEALECGAASLAMILAYHGRLVPLEELRIRCGISRDGSKASNIVKAARMYGLEAKGYKKELEGLRDLPLPMVLFWNFNHFVVLEGIKKDKVFLNDPASGPRTVTFEELDESFTGVALTFAPGPGFQKGGDRRSLLASLKARLTGSYRALTYVALAGLFLVIPGLLIPTFSRIFVDDILVGKMDGWLKPLLVAMGLTALLRGVLTWLQSYYLLRLETKMALTSSAKFFRHVFHLPVEFFAQRMGGEIGGRVLLNDKVASLLSGELASNMISFVMLGFYIVLMLQYDLLMTAVGVCFALVNLAVLKYVSGKRTVLNQKLQQEAGKLMGESMSGLQVIETLKAMGAESDFFSQWSGQHAKVVNARQEFAVRSRLLTLAPVLLMSLNSVAILALGGYRVMEGHISMGMLVAFQSLMTSFMQPVNQLVNLGGKIQETRADMDRLDDVMRYRPDRRFLKEDGGGDSATTEPAKLTGHLELKNVTFGYSRLEPPLIENFSLHLKPGERVALVGPSGSGKSTVAKVVTGLYEPWDGEILFDGRPFHEIDAARFNNSVAMVDQEIFLFQGSLQDNITMWDETISQSSIIQASKDACIHEDIASRQEGYAGQVSEAGGNFSGGQRQRLEIARALVNDPAILIMDEATSALDPSTEKTVDDNLRRRGCTCLIIAHRLSTIRDCDEIIVLDRGKVLQRGTHEEMCDKEGPYRELISMN